MILYSYSSTDDYKININESFKRCIELYLLSKVNMLILVFPSDLITILVILFGSIGSIAFCSFLAIKERNRTIRLIKNASIPAPPEFTNQECPLCGQSLSFISQYNRWYCHNCKKYP